MSDSPRRLITIGQLAEYAGVTIRSRTRVGGGSPRKPTPAAGPPTLQLSPQVAAQGRDGTQPAGSPGTGPTRTAQWF